MNAEALRDALPGLVPGLILLSPDANRGQVAASVDRARIAEVLPVLRDHPDLDFAMLSDLTAVDYLGREPRFEVVYNLYSIGRNHRLRVKVGVPEDDPTVPSAGSVWKSALWAEREVWDMFGIRFEGHPDLRRILMYEEFVGHPLRKDYPLLERQPLVPERDPITRPWNMRTGVR
jgi:NADH-quinone oxidoreductase subunit C